MNMYLYTTNGYFTYKNYLEFTETDFKIKNEIYWAIEKLGGQSDLLGTIASWKEEMSDKDILGCLKSWNSNYTGKSDT